MGNMREISVQECEAVFGGIDEPEEPGTIVTAPKKYQDNSFSERSWGVAGDGLGFGFANIADMFNSLPDSTLITAEDGDYDEDGIPDSQDTEDNRTIAVTATVAQLYAADIARIRAESDVGLAQVWLGILFGGKASTGGLSGAIEGGMSELSMQQIEEKLVQARAEYLYQQNKLDGVYDGVGPQDYERAPLRDPYM